MVINHLLNGMILQVGTYQLSSLFVLGHGRFRQMKFSAQDEDEVADILYDTVPCPAWLSLYE